MVGPPSALADLPIDNLVRRERWIIALIPQMSGTPTLTE